MTSLRFSPTHIPLTPLSHPAEPGAHLIQQLSRTHRRERGMQMLQHSMGCGNPPPASGTRPPAAASRPPARPHTAATHSFHPHTAATHPRHRCPTSLPPLAPTLDNLACSQSELEGLVAVVAGVKFGTVLQGALQAGSRWWQESSLEAGASGGSCGAWSGRLTRHLRTRRAGSYRPLLNQV